ncbi:MAG: peptide chain release factor N(5)-glutamine methyltransferase [Porphyromonadaceae bacterium]|nr:MAG: peptide chain release factor N(5)-glutamine methyltransferase [Porphyromonadaceae bacterium]
MIYSDINKLLRETLDNLYPDHEIESIGRLVLEHLTGMAWVQVRLNYGKEFIPDEKSQIGGIIARLIKHEPIQYILGETEFYGLKLKVRPGVLIPRGETEELVDWIIKAQGSRLKAQGKEGRAEGKKRLRVLDIGCGSGAIAIALAKYLPGAEVVASDISEEALQLTQENATLNHLELTIISLDILSPQGTCHPGEGRDPVTLLRGSPCHPGEGRDPVPDHDIRQGVNGSCSYDVIVSNPPYVPMGEMTSMDLHVVDYEPVQALFVPDNDPLLFYRAIAEFAATHLNPDGQVYVEIHDRLGEETANLFRKWFKNVELRKDIHGKDRMIRAHHG